jgi:DNA-binding transcriptional regulator GbsR (MarR family)
MVNLSGDNPSDDSRGYVWIKIRTNLIDNPKFMQLPDQAKSTYFELYLLAGKSDAFGLVLAGDEPATVQDLAWTLRKSESDMQNALDELQRAGFVDLDGGVTVAKFANEQGPAMAEKRRQWQLRQAKRRALAKGETWIEPDADTEAEPEPDAKKEKDAEKEKNTDTNTEQELKTQTKRVTQTSRESHARVTRDRFGGDDLIDSDLVLSVWHDMTGLEFKPNTNGPFDGMIKDWQRAGVTVQNVREAITQVDGTANTPMYLANIAKNLHKKETHRGESGTMTLETARQLRRQNQDQAGGGLDEILANAPIFAEDKQAGGDNDVHE